MSQITDFWSKFCLSDVHVDDIWSVSWCPQNYSRNNLLVFYVAMTTVHRNECFVIWASECLCSVQHSLYADSTSMSLRMIDIRVDKNGFHVCYEDNLFQFQGQDELLSLWHDYKGFIFWSVLSPFFSDTIPISTTAIIDSLPIWLLLHRGHGMQWLFPFRHSIV